MEYQNLKTKNTVTKVIDTIKEHLDISITEDQVKSRPVIVKLVKYNTRIKIFYNKEKLKRKNLVLMDYLKEAQEETGFLQHVVVRRMYNLQKWQQRSYCLL